MLEKLAFMVFNDYYFWYLMTTTFENMQKIKSCIQRDFILLIITNKAQQTRFNCKLKEYTKGSERIFSEYVA